MSLIIRPARLADAPEIIAAIDAVCAEKIYLLSERYVPNAPWEAVLRQEETPNHLLLAPVMDERIIGWCRVFAGPFPKTGHVADVGIGLLAPYRGQGIGAALMEHAIAWAIARGFEKLTADTFDDNARARALFRKMGFVESGARHRQYKINGIYRDQILLERFLP